MTQRPTKPFSQARDPQSKPANRENSPIRNKDNADHRIKPPRFAPHGELNRAPKGMSGIKRNLPSPDHQKAKHERGFDTEIKGRLSQTFKPIAHCRDKGRER